MQRSIASVLIPLFFIIPLFSQASSRYHFSFHHYNDIYSYSQAFSLPTQSTHAFFWRIDASQDASKNLTLSKEEDRYLISVITGIRPQKSLSIRFKEKISQNSIQAENISSKVTKNEFTIETPFTPKAWFSIMPYFIAISDRYEKTPEDSFTISNPGNGRGVKATIDVKNVANIETELKFLDQEISNEKKGHLDASIDKAFKGFRVGGNFNGKNILTQYPILNGREEKFLEAARGDVYTDFVLLNRLTTFIRYEGNFQNEIYSLLEGFGGKHNNEKKTYNTISSNVSYRLFGNLTCDVSIEGYKGEKTYQDRINDEVSTVKTLSPSITFRPHRNSRMILKHSIRLSSFSFPNPITVTDRDILEKSILFTSFYTLPTGTDLSLSMGRTENHIIYIRSEMSANNVTRTSYSLEAAVEQFIRRLAKIEEHFSLVSNYQLYDYTSQRNLFTRNFSFQTDIHLLLLRIIEPSAQYRLISQDWGPYRYSYEAKDYLFYRNVENRKQTYEVALELKPLTTLSVTPSYMLVRNRYKSFQELSETQITTFIEEHIGAQLKYKATENKILDFHITWIKRNEADDFFEIKARISYSV